MRSTWSGLCPLPEVGLGSNELKGLWHIGSYEFYDAADLLFLVEPSLSVGEHVFIFHNAGKHD